MPRFSRDLEDVGIKMTYNFDKCYDDRDTPTERIKKIPKAVQPIETGLEKLPRDIRKATARMNRQEIRFLVNLYYQIQEFRKATSNQIAALERSESPHETIAFFYDQSQALENQVKSSLDAWSKANELAAWCREHVGIGPVIAAGLIAHIDFERAPTVGHIWSFAGLNPQAKWEKGQRRPWNQELKTLCWRIGDSFVKQRNREGCFYGVLYEERKKQEVSKNEALEFADTAKETLETRNIKDAASRSYYEKGQLPPGRIDLRARRYAVKLFLAHFHQAGYRLFFEEDPPKPYPIAILGHAHEIECPVGLPPLASERTSKAKAASA